MSTIPKSGKTDQGVTETAYREEVRVLRVLSQENNHSLNVNTAKEMLVDFRQQQREHPSYPHRRDSSGEGGKV